MAQNYHAPAKGGSTSNLSNPNTQAEIDNLIFDETLAPEERLARLQSMREDLKILQQDKTENANTSGALMAIDDAIAELAATGVGSSIASPDGEVPEQLETLSSDDDMRASAEAGIEDELSADDDEQAAALSDWDAENDGHDGRNGYH